METNVVDIGVFEHPQDFVWTPEEEQEINRIETQELADWPFHPIRLPTTRRREAIRRMRGRLAHPVTSDASRPAPCGGVTPARLAAIERIRAARKAKGDQPRLEELSGIAPSRYFDRRVVARALVAVRSKTECPPSRARKLDPPSQRKLDPPRQSLSNEQKDLILGTQKYRCIYCGHRLGQIVWDSRGKPVTLATRWEHFEPFALRHNDTAENIFASCQICNDIKSDFVFDSLAECRIWLEREWEKRGYQDEFPGAKRFLSNLNLVSVN